MSHSHDYALDAGLPEMRVRLRVLEQRLGGCPAGASVLEVGVGAGDASLLLAEILHRRGGRLTCVDTDPHVLARVTSTLSSRGLPAPVCVHGRIEEASWSTGPFDAVVLFNVLEHLSDPVSVLARLRVALKDEGRMHVSVPLAGSLHRWLGVELGMIGHVAELAASDREFGHHRVYTVETLRADVEAAGLVVAEVHPFYLKPFPTSVLSPLPWNLHEALDALGGRFPEFASYVYLDVRPA